MKALSPLAETGAGGLRAASGAARAGLWLWRHGVWLPLTLALLLAAALLWWDATQLQARGQALAAARPAAGASAPLPPRVVADAENAAALRGLLPPAVDATAQVRRLVELTRPQLAWQRAEFQQSDDNAGGLLRVQVTVPVAGEYAAMRQALDRALAELPNVSLDQVQLRRLQPDATRLEARLRFSIWLAAARPEGSAR